MINKNGINHSSSNDSFNMKRNNFEIIEKVYQLYNVLFPFYLFYLIGMDGDQFHFSSSYEFLPSLYFFLFPALFYAFRKKGMAILPYVFSLLLVSQIFLIYLLFYWFTTQKIGSSLIIHELIVFFGIYSTLVQLLFHQGTSFFNNQ
jgi:hypothetical protein